MFSTIRTRLAGSFRSLIDEPRRIPWKFRYGLLAHAASGLRRSHARFTHLHTNVQFGEGVYLGPGFALRILEHGSLVLGNGVQVRRNFLCEIGGNGSVKVGDGCVFTGMVLIQISTVLEIGPDTHIGQGCVIVDGNHRFRDYRVHWNEQGYDLRPIRIGSGAAIHSNCIVAHNVGDRAVIGANSVVLKPIPPYCIAVGAPARVVVYFGPPEEKADLLAGYNVDV